MHRVLVAPCPECGKDLKFTYDTERIPYFSEVMFASAVCECGFKSVETYVLGSGDPVRYSLKIECADDLSSRVIRSTTGTIDIPEFGINVQPGPICEAFISNVEGVLLRVIDALNIIARDADTAEGRAKAVELQQTLEKARSGEVPFTLIIEDEDGNSGIVNKKAVKEILPKKEETA